MCETVILQKKNQGGGLHFDILDQFKGNQIKTQNSNFNNNRCSYPVASNSVGTGGGGIRIALLSQYGNDYQCHIALTNCTFVNNSAYYIWWWHFR